MTFVKVGIISRGRMDIKIETVNIYIEGGEQIMPLLQDVHDKITHVEVVLIDGINAIKAHIDDLKTQKGAATEEDLAGIITRLDNLQANVAAAQGEAATRKAQ